jgi:tetratricopeptide (TPR) repeat protein/class 3 adenylate cyclase
MRELIPRFILERAKEGVLRGRLEAAVLNIDLRGFTVLTQALVQRSESGAEVLSDVINAIFTPAISAIESGGGFIAGFAGDAFTAVFPLEADTETGKANALVAALEVRDHFVTGGIMKTEYGEHEVSAKLGLAWGQVEWTIVPAPEQNVYWFSEEGIDQAIRAQELAQPNQVVLGTGLPAGLDLAEIDLSALDDGHFILNGSTLPVKQVPPAGKRLPQGSFVPAGILGLKLEGEFRQVLSCFLNLARPEERQVEAIIGLCARYGGYFNKVDCTDKGWLALVLFGAPVAYEQTELRALQFCRELQARYGDCMRAGLSLGLAFTGFIGSRRRGEYTALGMAVNLGARYMYKAAWGEVWFDRRIHEAVGNAVVCDQLGALAFKGFPNPIPAYRLTEVKGTGTSRTYGSRFVGREAELLGLLDSCSPLFEGRCAGITYIYGEAGQGKSRLVYELGRSLEGRAQFHYLQCDGILREPLNPFAYWLRQLFTPSGAGTLNEHRNEFRTRWQDFVREVAAAAQARGEASPSEELERIESVLAGLLALDWEGSLYAQLSPRDRGTMTKFALRTLMRSLCRLKPLVLVLEDLHWMDSESNEVFGTITRQAEGIPFKLIVTSRPNDDESKPRLELDPELTVTAIDLCGWSREALAVFAGGILGHQTSDELGDFLFSQTQGNPFFTEQMCLYLEETDRFVLREDALYLNEEGLALPTGIQSLLVARLDRLERELKRTVQTASVLGLEFAVEILLELLKRSHSGAWHPEQARRQISDGERERLWNLVNRISCIFSHSLLRETAYKMQLVKKLRRLHLLAAQIMETAYAGDRSKAALVAEHYRQAQNWELAVKYFNLAGDHEHGQFHYGQSLKHHSAALELNREHLGPQHPDTAGSLQKVAIAYDDMGRHQTAVELLEQTLSIRGQALGTVHPDTASTYHNLAIACRGVNDFEGALRNYHKAVVIRTALHGRMHTDVAASLNNIGNIHDDRGEYDTALDYYRQAYEIWNEVHGARSPRTLTALSNIGNASRQKGDYPYALECLGQAYRIRKEVLGDKHPFTAVSLGILGDLHLAMKEEEKARECYEQALAIRREVLGDKHPDTAGSLNNIGGIYKRTGDYEKALDYYRQSLAIRRELLGSNHWETAVSLHNIGGVYHDMDEYEASLPYFKEALQIWTRLMGERHPLVGSALQSLGLAYRHLGDHANAIACYEQALSIRSEKLGPAHPDTQKTLNSLIKALEVSGNPEQAAHYRELANPGEAEGD